MSSLSSLLISSSLLLSFVGSCRERGASKAPAASEQPSQVARAAEAFGCTRAISQARSVLVVELAGIPGSGAPLERALAVASASCRDDAWPEALRRCLIDVPLVGPTGGAKGLWACAAEVPEALRPRLEQSLRAAIGQ